MTFAAPGWHVVYTRPDQERRAEGNLLRRCYDAWLPLLGKWARGVNSWASTTQPMLSASACRTGATGLSRTSFWVLRRRTNFMISRPSETSSLRP